MTDAQPPNPFVLGFGALPTAWAGRHEALSLIPDSLHQRTPTSQILLTGAKGTGKTALIGQWCAEAQQKGWAWVRVTARTGETIEVLMRRTLQEIALRATAATHARPVGFGSAEPTSADVPDLPDLPSEAVDLVFLLKMLSNASPAGVLVCVDEAHYMTTAELELLGTQLQDSQEGGLRALTIVLAGLPQMRDQVRHAKLPTFLERLHEVHVGFVDADDVADALERTLASVESTISPEALSLATEVIAGWPYVLQVVGHFMLRRAGGPGSHVSDADVRAALPAISERVGDALLSSTWQRLSNRDRDVMVALAATNTSVMRVAEVRQALDMSTRLFGVYRARLISQNLLASAGQGLLRFTLPFIAEWVRQRADHDELVEEVEAASTARRRRDGALLAERAAGSIERHRQASPRCVWIGKRSQRQCVRPLGHSGQHRYA